MIADLKSYGEYKESGLPWLGQVPRHWRSRRMKFLFKERAQKGFPNEPLLAATQSKGVIRKEDYGLRTVTAVNGLENLKLVEVGDFVISLRSFQGGIEVSHARGIISPAYTVLQPRNDFEPRYFKSYFKSADFINSLTLFVTGIREGQNIDYERLSHAFMPLPPPDEQAAIVRFLDWANGRLERAIRAKRKVIALLGEQKQAIIHRAVTRGLDPPVPLKSSGIPWLGDIPQHWSQQALWTLSSLRTERNPGKLPLLSVFLDRGVIRYEEGGGQVHAPSLDLSSYQVVRAGDFVLNNQQAWRGSVGVSRHEGIISPAYIVLSLSKRLDSRFANYLMRSRVLVDQFVAASKGVGDIQRQIFWPFLRMVQVPLPTVEEQGAIAQHLEAATAGLIHSISRLEREIELLREYRTRLVADVVTGKLDVREATARLPDEAPLDVGEGDAELSDETEAVDEEAAV
jgi:type I restriction enzyme S subunit